MFLPSKADYRFSFPIIASHPSTPTLRDCMTSSRACAQPFHHQPMPVSRPAHCWSRAIQPAQISPLRHSFTSNATDGRCAAGALLFYGVYDADFETASYRQFVDGPGLTTAKMQRYWNWYVGEHDRRRDPLVSPLRASDDALRALPPLYLMAAGIDPLLSDSLNLAARLQSLGRQETVAIVPGVVHGFLQMSNELLAARQALAAAGSAAREMTIVQQA